MRLRSRRPGFSLMEMMMVASLTAVTIGLMLVNTKGGRRQVTCETLGVALVEELRQARALAISSQTPVGVIFPGTDASGSPQPVSCSFYQLEGWSNPKVTRVRKMQGDFPGLAIFQGSWSVDPSQLRNPSSVNQANPSVLGDKWADWQLDNWLPASAHRDYCFIFTPDGRVHTNDLPSFDHAYHILVSNGVASYAGASPPSNTRMSSQPAYFQPTSLGPTCTISLDAGGGISLSSGVLASSGGVQVLRSASVAPFNSAVPRLDGHIQPVPDTPVVKISSLGPNPAPGTDVSVSPDGYITLEANVGDTAKSGERLYCNWKVTPQSGNVGTGPSDYSIPVAGGRGVAMDWDPKTTRWRSTWEWRPPANARGGDKFDLSLVIQDSSGTSLTAEVQKKVVVCPPGEVYFGSGSTFLFLAYGGRMNLDGSARREMQFPPFSTGNPSPKGEVFLGASAEGSRLVVGSPRENPDTSPTGIGWAMYITNRDGTSFFRVSNNPAQACECASLSPFGNLVAYKQAVGGTIMLRVTNVDPDPARRATIDVADLGPDGGNFLETGPNPIREKLMGRDRLSWDMRVDGPDNNTLYYTMFDGASGLSTHIHKYTVQLNALGQPEARASVPTIGTPDPQAPITMQAMAPYSFTRVTAAGVREDYIFFTANVGAGKTGFYRFGPPAVEGIAEAGSPNGDSQPSPYVEGDQLKLLVQENLPSQFAGIVSLTPPMSDTSATDRRVLASPSQGNVNAFNPNFAPAHP
ncbi:MAG: hypothetical protein U0931_22795 [Vulcanimicrobiota bacterium]